MEPQAARSTVDPRAQNVWLRAPEERRRNLVPEMRRPTPRALAEASDACGNDWLDERAWAYSNPVQAQDSS
jgi:hypothetical protein